MLVKSLEGHNLCLYVAVSENAISVVVVQEQGKSQDLVYCICKVLQEAKTQYQMIEKLVLTLVTSTSCLHRPPYSAGAVEIRARKEDDYMVDRTIRILFEVRAEGSNKVLCPRGLHSRDGLGPKGRSLVDLYMDGLSNLKGGGTSIILEGLGEVVLEHSLKFDFKASNNQAKYEALLVGLDLALEVGI
ncbi:hypothetical protein CR513_08991, partial [Mucuna pruriens]